MLPPVEADEHLLAQGLYQQLHHDSPTEIREQWSIHSLPDNALIWRSQLLYSNMPLSACYLLRDPDYNPVQMVFFWQWQNGQHGMVEYRFMPRYAMIVEGDHAQDVILPANFGLYCWHTITEHFLWLKYDWDRGGKQSFNLLKPGVQRGTLRPSVTSLEATLTQTQIMPGPNGPTKAHVFAIHEPDIGPQTLHINELGVPLRWDLPSENLTVILDAYTRDDEING